MAFSTSNVQRTAFGNLKVTYGDWSGSVGDADGSIGVAGGRVYLHEFNIQDSSGPQMAKVPTSVSTSGTVTTITVYNRQAVTTGRFLIIHS